MNGRVDRARAVAVTAAWVAACFGYLARPELTELDTAVARWLTSHGGPWPRAAELVSDATPSVGGGVALLVLAAVVAYRSRRAAPLLLAAGAIVTSGIVVALGKLALPQHADLVHGLPAARYPSGPITIAVVVGGTGILVLAGVLSPALRHLARLFVAGVVTAIGVAEVHLGQHRLSDVVASVLLGLALLATVTLAAQMLAPARYQGPSPSPDGRTMTQSLVAASRTRRPVEDATRTSPLRPSAAKTLTTPPGTTPAPRRQVSRWGADWIRSRM